MININHKEWDTTNFGFKVGSAIIKKPEIFNIENFRNKAKNEGFKLIYLESPIKLEGSNLFFDEKIIYSKPNIIRQESKPFDEISSYNFNVIDNDLYNLSIISGEYSRFNLDKNFPKNKFILLYNKWIENSVLANYATDVIVYKIENKIVGLLTYYNQNNISNIGIIAVNPNFQGHGIGSKLIKHYQNQLDNKITELEVVTQGVNLKARVFYEKNEYKIKSKTYIYHLWL